jgi:hypothetical protein
MQSGLILQIKNHNIFIHSFPAGLVNFIPHFFRDANQKGKWSIQVVNELWGQKAEH